MMEEEDLVFLLVTKEKLESDVTVSDGRFGDTSLLSSHGVLRLDGKDTERRLVLLAVASVLFHKTLLD